MANDIDTVLFDLDGTLIDSIELILASYRHTMQSHLGRTPDDALWLAGIGTPLRVQLAEFAEGASQAQAMLESFRQFNIANHDQMVRAYEGVDSTLDTLRTRGVKLGLVTSKVRVGANRGLRLGGWEEHFSVVVCSDDVTQPKPAAEPVQLALRELRSVPERAVFVGDSLHDMKSGRHAEVRTAAALWGPFDRAHLAPSEPDYWLDHPSDVLALC